MKQLRTIMNDREFVKKALAITIPVALQNMLNNLLNLVDTLMIGQLGDTSIAAVGLANKLFFVFCLLMFGVCSGSSILASQYFGKREMWNIKRLLRISLILGIGGSFLFMIPALIAPELVMRIFTPQAGTIAIGSAYLVIVAISYPLTAITNAYVAILRSMNYVVLPVIITSVSILVNVVLNYGLIFGKLGLPEMGVAGAALATLIARIVECVLLLIIIYRYKAGDGGIGDFVHQKYIKVKGNSLFQKEFIVRYFRTASPVIINEFMWGLGVTMYALVYGRMGDEATAAITITSSMEQIASVFFFGICHAAAVILGNELGANRLEKAKEYAKNFIFIQFLVSVVGAVLLFFMKDSIIGLFQVSEIVSEYIRLSVVVFTLYMPLRMLNALFIVAVLRSGGDTVASLFLDITGVWFIGIPMAIIGGLVLQLPIYIVYAMISMEEIYKLILSYIRYRQGKWVKNIVTE